ncbi:MAG TPA: cbb3-type cytochrome oxidase assembly protein CcoS [Phycisphaerales bacterium]|nr:cbb3-type cytochrome oxidase assembly protein CcoS [Phycisphaerales bacterium]
MSVIFIVLPIAIVMAAAAVTAFILAARNGQFDDLDTPAHRAIQDE